MARTHGVHAGKTRLLTATSVSRASTPVYYPAPATGSPFSTILAGDAATRVFSRLRAFETIAGTWGMGHRVWTPWTGLIEGEIEILVSFDGTIECYWAGFCGFREGFWWLWVLLESGCTGCYTECLKTWTLNFTKATQFRRNIQYKSFTVLGAKYNCLIYLLFVRHFKAYLKVIFSFWNRNLYFSLYILILRESRGNIFMG